MNFIRRMGLGCVTLLLVLSAACEAAADGPAAEPPSASPAPAEAASPTPDAPEGPRRGVSLSPRSFAQEDFVGFFQEAAGEGWLVRGTGAWADLDDPDSPVHVVATLADQFGYRPIIDVSVGSVDSHQLYRPLTPETTDYYVRIAAEFAERYRPPYMGLGVEIDLLYDRVDADIEEFAALFDRTYDAIKEVSPDTRVYTEFQLEWLSGRRGGLFGGESDPSQATWELVDLFSKSDFMAFTSYPHLVYRDPSEIPDDYYLEVWERGGRKPPAFMEMGWFLADDIPGWESDEAVQARYLDRLYELTADVEVELLVWPFLYDPGIQNRAFLGMTLRRDDGSPRPAHGVWTGAR